MTQMYCQYGAYKHAPGEANLVSFTIKPRRTAREFQVANLVTAQVSGCLKVDDGEDEYDLTPKIQALDDALSRDGYDFGLYHSDGSPTHHVMESGDLYNMTGNQVVHRTYPQSHNGEYSTGRDFAYAIQAQYQASESNILEYSETVSHTGTTGPAVKWYQQKRLPPIYRVDAFATTQKIVQTGYARTLYTWLVPPPPVLPPPIYLPHLTQITRSTPKRYPQGVEGHFIRWTYHYESPAVVPLFPNMR